MSRYDCLHDSANMYECACHAGDRSSYVYGAIVALHLIVCHCVRIVVCVRVRARVGVHACGRVVCGVSD